MSSTPIAFVPRGREIAFGPGLVTTEDREGEYWEGGSAVPQWYPEIRCGGASLYVDLLVRPIGPEPITFGSGE